MSASSSEPNPYPHLGFNPVPGEPGAVEYLSGVLKQAGSALKESGTLLSQVRQSGAGVWQGAAGDAFRSHVDDSLTDRLSKAQTSMETAVGVLGDWHGDLVSLKSTASRLDQEAADARTAARNAGDRLAQAKASPDLGLAGKHFDTDAALQQAQHRLDDAENAVRQAQSTLDDANEHLQAILNRAKELASHAESLCRDYAQKLDHAASDLAPHKPGMFSRMWHSVTSAFDAVGSWVSDHLDAIHSVLSTISAIAGLVAALTPPPIDAIALAVSVTAGAGALAVDLANPEFRAGMGQLLTGHFNKQARDALFTGATDVFSVVPGATVAAKLIKGGKEAESLASLASTAAHTGITPKLLAKAPGIERTLQTVGLLGKTYTETDLISAAQKAWKIKGAASQVEKDIKEAVS